MRTNPVKLSEVIDSTFEEKVGVYCFYCLAKIADYDIELDNDFESNFSQKIDNKYIEPLNRNTLKTKVDLNYNSYLEGDLSYTSDSIENSNFHNHITDESKDSETIFRKVENRLAFRSLMSEIFIDFSTPIYIGSTHNIRERVLQHQDDFYNGLEKKKESIDPFSENFGERASTYFDPEEIYVIVKYIDPEDIEISKSDKFYLAKIIEKVFHKKFRPKFGRK